MVKAPADVSIPHRQVGALGAGGELAAAQPPQLVERLRQRLATRARQRLARVWRVLMSASHLGLALRGQRR